MKRLLRVIKNFLSRNLGSRVDEFYWSKRHLLEPNWVKEQISPNSLNHPHRQFLIEKISGYLPFRTLLEVGSASGPNLYFLAKKFPTAEFYGVDISNQAIETGREWFKKEGLNNIKLIQSAADNLGVFKNKSVDIVITDATLIYVGPEKIMKILVEMLKIARKTLILNEWHSDEIKKSVLQNDHWIHNYKYLLGKLPGVDKIEITKLPEGTWSGDWAKYGYIIEADIAQ